MKAWASNTSLLPAMRPAVYIPMDVFPKNAAGKIDRAALPDASEALQAISTHNYEPPATEEENTMVDIWEKVLKIQVGVLTPFVAYGGHSLTAVQLCSRVNAAFHCRPDLVFLMSEDCTVRALLEKLRSSRSTDGSPVGSGMGCVIRLSPPEQRGLPMIIFCAAGTSAATYQAVAERTSRLQLFAVELPGRGFRAEEPTVSEFQQLFESLKGDVMTWARKYKSLWLQQGSCFPYFSTSTAMHSTLFWCDICVFYFTHPRVCLKHMSGFQSSTLRLKFSISHVQRETAQECFQSRFCRSFMFSNLKTSDRQIDLKICSLGASTLGVIAWAPSLHTSLHDFGIMTPRPIWWGFLLVETWLKVLVTSHDHLDFDKAWPIII